MSLNCTGIEYLTHTWNPYTGCLNWVNGVCGGGGQQFDCWAKGLVEGRLRRFYPYGFRPTFFPERLLDPLKRKKPARIGAAFMGDLFIERMKEGKIIPDAEGNLWSGQGIMESIFRVIEQCPQLTFVFLTKCPQNLARWNPWPDNCWVGASATNREQYLKATGANGLDGVEAKVKFLSFEPLLERIGVHAFRLEGNINWVILGGRSGKGKSFPQEAWIQEIETEADSLGIPCFEKDNLRKEWTRPPRREYAHLRG